MFAICLVWIQILGEMLPISSSSQLILFGLFWKAYYGVSAPVIPKGFDYLLHIPLLFVVPLFFRKSWFPLLALLCKRIYQRQRLGCWSSRKLLQYLASLIGIIFVSTLLAAVVDAVLGKYASLDGLRPWGMVLCAALLYMSQYYRIFWFESLSCNKRQVLFFVGIAQAVALLPGISRMGLTIALGLLLGMSLRRAFEYSFALQLPLVVAAVVFKALPWVLSVDATSWLSLPLMMHMIAAGVFSYFMLSLSYFIFKLRKAFFFALYLLACAIVFWHM